MMYIIVTIFGVLVDAKGCINCYIITRLSKKLNTFLKKKVV